MALVTVRSGLLLAGILFNESQRRKQSKVRRQRRHYGVKAHLKGLDGVFHRDDVEYGDDDVRHAPACRPSQPSCFSSSKSSPRDQGVWLLDTGAAQHSCSDRSLFGTYRPARGFVTGIGSQVLKICGTGTVLLNVIVDGFPRTLVLDNVSHVPHQTCEHLLSFDPFLRQGGRLWTEGWMTYIADSGGEVLFQCSRVNGACQVDLDLDPEWTKMQVQRKNQQYDKN